MPFSCIDRFHGTDSEFTFAVDRGNQIRHIIMLVLIIVMFFVIFVQCITALANSYCPTDRQPRNHPVCRYFDGCVTVLMLVFLVIMSIFATLLLVVASTMADFCIAPAENIIRVGDISNSVAIYYVNILRTKNDLMPSHRAYIYIYATHTQGHL